LLDTQKSIILAEEGKKENDFATLVARKKETLNNLRERIEENELEKLCELQKEIVRFENTKLSEERTKLLK